MDADLANYGERATEDELLRYCLLKMNY